MSFLYLSLEPEAGGEEGSSETSLPVRIQMARTSTFHFFSPNEDPKMSQETCTSNSQVRIRASLKEKRGEEGRKGRQVWESIGGRERERKRD